MNRKQKENKIELLAPARLRHRLRPASRQGGRGKCGYFVIFLIKHEY